MISDILGEIGKSNNVTNAIILTYNIDFLFFENIVIPRLRRCGNPITTIFADSNCVSESYQRHSRWIAGIGKRYRVVPVEMQKRFCFHPKAVLLSSQKKGVLFIGSGNLGYDGWRGNGEIWVRFDSDIDGGAPFSAFRGFLERIIEGISISNPIVSEVNEAFDLRMKKWTSELGKADKLYYKCAEGDSLMEQMISELKKKRINQLTICSPYFDYKLGALKKIVGRLKVPKTKLLVQKRNSGLPKKAANSLQSSISIQTVDFRREKRRNVFLHAKFYAFEDSDDVTIFVGSANCSKAALSIPGKNGNAELLAIQRMPKKEFERKYLGELKFLKSAPLLKDMVEEFEGHMSERKLRILAARYDAGELWIGYRSDSDTKIIKCLVNKESLHFERVEENKLLVRMNQRPDQVSLVGRKSRKSIESLTSWVDSEFDLRATSRERSLADAIKRVEPGTWNISPWIDILNLLHKYLKYSPAERLSLTSESKNSANNSEIEYSMEDIFADDYGSGLSIHIHLPQGKVALLEELQQMLLRRFHFTEGIHTLEEQGLEETKNVNNNGEDDNIVDREEELPSSVHLSKTENFSEEDKIRANKIISKITKSMTDPEFLSNRAPEQLGIDLSIISILLRIGYSKSWINKDDFLVLTRKIWAVLFFSRGEIESELKYKGWIQYRYDKSQAPNYFARKLASNELSSALFAWVIVTPQDTKTTEEALFVLACALSVARLPWLWNVSQWSEVAKILKKDLILTGILDPKDEKEWNLCCSRWRNLIQKGFALLKFEKAMDGMDFPSVQSQIKREQLKKGEILWQGARGLCLLSEDCRKSDKTVDVLCLQQSENPQKLFAADSLVPFDDLISSEDILSLKLLGKKERVILKDFIDELSKAFIPSITENGENS